MAITQANSTVGRLERVAVALDTSDWSEFEGWCQCFGPRVGVLKVGLESYLSFGERAVVAAQRSGARLFLDLKLHDIPNTVAAAVRAVRSLGAHYVTVHSGGSRPMLEAAVEAADGKLGILAVTLLTHLEAPDLELLGLEGGTVPQVLRRARVARESGAAGIVCSALEVEALRSRFERPFRLVTPGVRFADQKARVAGDDQGRVATPRQALEWGSDLLVIGRPLTQADDPTAAIEALAAELHGLS